MPGLSGGQQAVAMFMLIVVASLTVLAPLAVYLLMGAKAATVLGGWKTWLVDHNTSIMFVLFLELGSALIGKGIAGLG